MRWLRTKLTGYYFFDGQVFEPYREFQEWALFRSVEHTEHISNWLIFKLVDGKPPEPPDPENNCIYFENVRTGPALKRLKEQATGLRSDLEGPRTQYNDPEYERVTNAIKGLSIFDVFAVLEGRLHVNGLGTHKPKNIPIDEQERGEQLAQRRAKRAASST